jgi:hypothetical protein
MAPHNRYNPGGVDFTAFDSIFEVKDSSHIKQLNLHRKRLARLA